jgi:hypothetical protein
MVPGKWEVASGKGEGRWKRAEEREGNRRNRGKVPKEREVGEKTTA